MVFTVVPFASGLVGGRATGGDLAEDCVERTARGQLLWRAVEQHSPAGDDDRARAHRLDFFEDVGRQHNGLAGRHLLDERAHFVLLIRVQAVGRFVQNQHLRVMQAQG